MKHMKYLFTCLLLALATTSLVAQKQTFDAATYTAPPGWKKTAHTTSVISYATTNNENGTYCQIGIYASTASKGSLQADFKSEWDELIVKLYKPTEAVTLVPATSDNGWDMQGGTAPFEFSGGRSIAMLVTASGHGRCMSIVIVTNTVDHQEEMQEFLESVTLNKPETLTTPIDLPGNDIAQKATDVAQPPAATDFRFSTSNFDDGWTSTIREDWVEVTKGNLKVLIHYPSKKTDEYNPVLLDKLKNSWDLLIAPRYSAASNFEFKPYSDWQSLEYAEANAVERETGNRVFVVLFKFNYFNGGGVYMEFITPDKPTFEREFGAYHQSTSGWEKMERMNGYNKFAIAESDLKGTWSNNYSGTLQYVNANTGLDAGMSSHASNEKFVFGPGNTYQWSLGLASGMVGNLKFQSVKSSGNFSVPDNWRVTFSDIEGKPKTYNAHFACVKGARVLWLGETGFGRVE